MAEKYSEKEILKMAMGLLPEDRSADIDRDGAITSADARELERELSGLSAPHPVIKTDKSDYTSMSEKVLDKIMASDGYSFDVDADELFRRYREQYENEGMKAARDVFGLASANTGGYGNSYAASAASGAYNSYLEKLSAKRQEIEGEQYKRYLNEREALNGLYDKVSDQEDRLYARFRDDVADHYKDESNYAARLEARLSDALKTAQIGDYSALEDLGIDTSALKNADEREKADFFAKYADLSPLEALGVDTSALKDKGERELAEFFAKYSDLAPLEKLGVDTSALKEKDERDKAKLFAQYADYSLLEELGADVSEIERQDLENIARIFAQYGDYSLLEALGFDSYSQRSLDALKRAVLAARLY